MNNKNSEDKLHIRPVRISLVYLFVSAVWIFFSDQWLMALSPGIDELSYLQTIKGLVFITTTAALIYYLIRRDIKDLFNEKVLLEKTIGIMKDTENELKASEARYRLLFENSKDAILIAAPSGEVFAANAAACSMFRMSETELCTRGRSRLVDQTDPKLQSYLDERKRTGNAFGELNMIRGDGKIFPAEVSSRIFLDSNGNERTSLIIRDISERKRMERELLEREKFLEAITETVPDVLYLYNPQEQKHLYLNRELGTLLGYTSAEILEKGADLILKSIHPNDLPSVIKHIGILSTTESNELYHLVYRIKGKDGNYLWFYIREQVYERDENGLPKTLFGVVQDITKSKYSEEKLHQLMNRLIESEEQLRKTAAHQLHDQVGQNLTALTINLNYIFSKLKGYTDEAIEKRLDDSINILNETIEQTRNIMVELRPAILDDYGLNAALNWSISKYSERTGLKVNYIGKDLGSRLPLNTEYTIFRLAQEAFHNISKHSKASLVSVELKETADRVKLLISDNGIGFDVDKIKQRTVQGLGLVGMAERIRLIGGQFNIDSQPGKGTNLKVEVMR